MRYWEVEQCQEASVAGKIRSHTEFWEEELKAPPINLNNVKHGYKIPFVSEPPSYYAKNNKSSLSNQDFAEDSICELLKNKCIVETEIPPHCVNPLTVASSKLRLVLDLRHVNKHLVNQKFKYENLKTVSELFEEYDYFFTFDLKSGYHHVPINSERQKYLVFAWEMEGKTKYFKISCTAIWLK